MTLYASFHHHCRKDFKKHLVSRGKQKAYQPSLVETQGGILKVN